MSPLNKTVRLAALAGALVVLLGVFFLGVRPWYLRWGATDAEVRRPLPGDELVRDVRAGDSATRAITIRAPAWRVWSWVAQLGQDRGGFYSYELLEDLVGCRMENAKRLDPEWQHWRLGDKLWMYPPERLGGLGHALLAVYEPGYALGFATRQTGTPASAPYDGSWSFVVQPIDSETTRLIARGRAGGTRAFLGAAFDHFVFEPIHFVMERKMLVGIKQRAEGGRVTPEAIDALQVALWTLMFGALLTAAVLVFRRDRWVQPLVVFVAAAVGFQYLTLRQPATWFGALLVFAVMSTLWKVRGTKPARPSAAAAGGEPHAAGSAARA